ncbi:MAG TPA: acyltransferase family protein [Acidimicrobiales bacterium]|nr:acyltransferase family protein [Acidimicrobiales bacterium]
MGSGGEGAGVARGRYLPSLDGLRAVAVCGVVLYHLRVGWLRGGYLGVDLFFVLSGFLITSLLVEERAATGGIGLRSFWSRRARRLLPALLAMLVALSAFTVLTRHDTAVPVDLGTLRADALGTLAYVANWHQLLAHQSYFAQFAGPSPLQHTWSLAIEEQFYVVWPLAVLGLLALVRRRGVLPAGRWRRHAAVGATAVAVVASATWMAVLARHGGNLDRIYYGTDTRAFDLMVGAGLAFLVTARPAPAGRGKVLLRIGAVAGAAVLAACWWLGANPDGTPSHWMFEGGFLLCAVAAAAVIADARQDGGGVFGLVLGLGVVRWVGAISYGVYLWHWPVIVEVNGARTGLGRLPLDLLRVGLTVVIAAASFYLLERPIRRRSFAGWPRAVRLALVPAGAALCASAVFVATVAPATSASAAVGTGGVGVLSGRDGPAGSGGLSRQPALRLAAGRVPSTADPLRVLLIGDSVMYTEAPAVTAALDSTGQVQVTDASFPGWGLTTASQWPSEVAAVVARTRADVVMAMWSWDDDAALAHPVQYRALVHRFVDTVLAPGDGVSGLVFVQFPQLGPVISLTDPSQAAATTAQRAKGVRAWNAVVSAMPAAYPGRVMYFPVASAVETRGRFASWLPPEGRPAAPAAGWLRVRMVDNVHFCPAGAARYAAALEADLSSVLGLAPMAPAWIDGAWTSSDRFLHKPGLSLPCPDDHPAGPPTALASG